MTGQQMVSIRLPDDLKDTIREKANQSGVTVSDLIRRSVLEWLGECPTCGQPIPAAARATTE